LEGVVRLADWHASAAPSVVQGGIRRPPDPDGADAQNPNAASVNPTERFAASDDTEEVLA
jgi:hypothetical protein